MMKKINYYLIIIATFLLAQNVSAQNFEIKGNVVGASDGMPLPGVNVLIKNTTTGAQTDFDGNYTIIANTGDLLVFSYIGMKPQSITVGNKKIINISMLEDTEQLGEIVVTALGIKRQKKALTYSTQNVNADDLTKGRPVNIVDGLSGKIAGLSVTTGGAGVGSESRVLLRGNRSIILR